MNHSSFIQTLSQRLGVTPADAQEKVDALIAVFKENLAVGNQINISSFGLFDMQLKKEQIIVDPTTKKKMLVPPRLELKFQGK
ncbi:MAG: HU family DNA-binding protein [Bacteroidaceae bacterium]|nr:HU family DNA-binding protein [Bacteroidaceae bacterium]